MNPIRGPRLSGRVEIVSPRVLPPLEEMRYFAIADVARMVGVTVQGVHYWIRTGKIRGLRRTSKRGNYLIPREELARLLREARREVPGIWVRERKKVLFIDDYEPIRKLVKLAFRDHRFALEVETAANAEDGLLEAALFKPDVIVLDYFASKGRLTTDQALTFMARAKLMKGVKVIGMAAEKREGARMLRAGADEILLKPFSLHELREAVLRQTSTNIGRDSRRWKALRALVRDPSPSN